MIKSDKTNYVIEYLSRIIEKINYGDKLPPLRTIIKDCHVSQTVATRALDELLHLGIVAAKPQKGYYKAKNCTRQAHIVYFKGDNQDIIKENTFYNKNLSILLLELVKNNFNVTFHMVDKLDDLPFFPDSENNSNYQHQRLIVTFNFRIEATEQMEVMKKYGFRFFHWLPNTSESLANSVYIAGKNIIKEQIDILYNYGHRKIAYLHQRSDKVWHNKTNVRYEEFCTMAFQKRLQIEPNYLLYFHQLNTPQEVCDKWIEDLIKEDLLPTAIILAEDLMALKVYKALKKYNINIGEDISIVGTNDQTFSKYMDPALTSIRFDINAGIKLLLDYIASLDRGEDISLEAQSLPCNLIVRESLINLLEEK